MTKKNWIQKVNRSIKARGTKGKCTPITKKGCTGRAKALAKTFKKMAAKRKHAAAGGYMGPSIKGDYAGHNLSNASYRNYYKGMLD